MRSNFQSLGIEWSQFTKPFSFTVWIAYISTTAVLISGYYLAVQYDHSTLAESFSWLGWVLFVFVFAFYNGALTMFFTSEPKLPFDNLKGAIRAYPQWKVIMQKDTDVLFQPRAAAGETEFMVILFLINYLKIK